MQGKAITHTQVVNALKKADAEINDAANMKSIELEDFLQVATGAINATDTLTNSLTDIQINEGQDEGHGEGHDELNIRELRGLNKAMQTQRGELTNNLAKLTELDKNIALEKRKLAEAAPEDRDRITERTRNLQEEREPRLANREALRCQISRIRETISRVLDEDLTLGERIRTLFREQGVTIASIVTALGFIVSTLVLALTGGGGGGVAMAVVPNAATGVKKILQDLGRILANLAGKAAAALPGIIGSIVAWLLTFLSKVAGWLSGNIWALVVALGGLLYVAVKPKNS